MKKLVILWLVALPWAALAQTNLTIDQAVKTALEKNLSLDRSSIDLGTKKRQNDVAWGTLLPSVSASTSLVRPNKATNSLGNDVDPTWTQNVSYGASLSWGAGALADIAMVQTNYKGGLISYDNARRSLEKSVRTAFYSLLLQAENIKLEAQAIDRAQQQYDQVLANNKAGLVPDLDVMSAQVNLASLKPTLDSLKASFTKQLGQFKQLLGLALDQDLALTGDLDQFSVQDKLLSDLKGGESFDVQSLRLALEAAQQNKLSLELSAYLPTFSVGWTSIPSRTDVFGQPSTWKDSAGNLTLTLSYSLNAFLPWTTTHENIAGAEDQIKKYQSQISEQVQTQAIDRQNNLLQIRQSIKSLEALELNVQLAQKTYNLSLDAYKRGAKDLVSLQSSEGDLQKARYNVLSERYTLLTTILNLEYEENLPFGTLLGGKS